MERTEPVWIIDRTVKWYSCYGKQDADFSKKPDEYYNMMNLEDIMLSEINQSQKEKSV